VADESFGVRNGGRHLPLGRLSGHALYPVTHYKRAPETGIGQPSPRGKTQAVRAWLHFGCNKLVKKAGELSRKYLDFRQLRTGESSPEKAGVDGYESQFSSYALPAAFAASVFTRLRKKSLAAVSSKKT
jgi:hypothetical protein